LEHGLLTPALFVRAAARAKLSAKLAHKKLTDISESLLYQRIMPIIPLPSDAVVHGKERSKQHDKIVQYIKEKRTVYAFHKKYGYGIRSLVEALFSRIKRCLGSTLLTQREPSQNNEGIIIANIINLWNSFGTCNSQKIG
tara:strand:- start:566 stop:985 length:420 start_codon:yes stop_codon:yes gene_type:complete